MLATGGEDYVDNRQSKLYWWQLALLFLEAAVSMLLCVIGFILYLVAKVNLHVTAIFEWTATTHSDLEAQECVTM